MATRTHHKTVEFEVVPDEIDGWDLKRRGADLPISNHATRQSAEEAARVIAAEEGGEASVEVREHAVEHLDEGSGVRVFLLALGGLLLLALLVLVVVSIIGATTDFGA
jgi:Uncharacterized protein conserved in bacteria (DUF2188)